jgi:uncharacterized protein YbaR (Trm112 family)
MTDEGERSLAQRCEIDIKREERQRWYRIVKGLPNCLVSNWEFNVEG